MTQGHEISFRVDRSMYDARRTDLKKVYGDLDRIVEPNLHLHYSTPICAQRWLDVCEDPDYGHIELLSRINEVFPRFLQIARANNEFGSSLTLTSLGSGDGTVDHCILRHMDEQVTVASYWGLDLSFELLCRAMHRIGLGSGFRQSFPIYAVCGDFTEPRNGVPNDINQNASRVFSLTGFTMGNFAERNLLSRIEALMRPRDYLLLDARIHSFGPVSENEPLIRDKGEKTFSSYEIPSVKRFVFGPLELATRATIEDVDIRYEVAQSLTTVPNAINIVIYCEGLDTKMRFTDQRVRRDRLDLAVTTIYRYEDLENWLVQSGFRLVASEQSSGMAFFLLQRKESEEGNSR